MVKSAIDSRKNLKPVFCKSTGRLLLRQKHFLKKVAIDVLLLMFVTVIPNAKLLLKM